ncbi:hypothetical protein [Thiomicrorhabdus indica]|uniref:hypothetical protein n=2 Tax=Thiomicrorhabdus indica TaxID=2267253 RepID=UPI00102D8427|nr:hypothetical protein [Thiomicrorhabdus indica]
MKTTSNNSNNLNRLNKLNLALLLALSTSLVGCGGGGGSSNPDTPIEQPDPDTDPGTDPEPTTPEALELTASDALDYGVAFQRAMYVFTETLQPYANGDQPQEVVKALFYYPQAAKLAYDNVIQPNAACDSGSATPQMVDLNSDGQVTLEGESMSYTFNQCQITTDSGTMLLDGTLQYAYQATQTVTEHQALLTYTHLTVQTQAATFALDGNRLLEINTNGGLVLTSTVQNGLTQTATAGDQSSGNALQDGYTQSYQRQGNEWQLSVTGQSVLTQGNQQAVLTTSQSEAFRGLVNGNQDHEPYQGQYQILWNTGDMALMDKALQFQSVASTQVTEDYQVQINFLDDAGSDTISDSFTINWAGTNPND